MPRPRRRAHSIKGEFVQRASVASSHAASPNVRSAAEIGLIEVLRRWSLIDQGTSFDARSRFTFCFTSFARSIAAFAQSCSLAGRGVNVA